MIFLSNVFRSGFIFLIKYTSEAPSKESQDHLKEDRSMSKNESSFYHQLFNIHFSYIGSSELVAMNVLVECAS